MELFEIISLRTSEYHQKRARVYMKKVCKLVKKHNSCNANFYIHDSLSGDLAIIISSNSKDKKLMGTETGIYINDVLKQFGLVDHNCWLLVE